MAYRVINVRPRTSVEWCFLRDWPEDVDDESYRFGAGEPFGDDYPSNARVHMSDREPGMQLPSLIGNTRSLLIVHQALKEVVAEINEGPTEYLPLHIYNHKQRLASDEYFVIHPLGVWDCLDLEASEIEYLDDEVVGIDRTVLDPGKLEAAPDLFRIREDPYRYVVSDRLWKALMALDPQPSNLEAKPLEVSGG